MGALLTKVPFVQRRVAACVELLRDAFARIAAAARTATAAEIPPSPAHRWQHLAICKIGSLKNRHKVVASQATSLLDATQ